MQVRLSWGSVVRLVENYFGGVVSSQDSGVERQKFCGGYEEKNVTTVTAEIFSISAVTLPNNALLGY